ncbi:hypothetical protein QBC43DRAFT_63525 [Cladorrhinum sp. PSN259]|nr:hypothetical protein QBC43DRAFT_63525 [Cladorrhinum sp. PSN259]
MKTPRPNKNWEGSNPSLPSSVSSALNGSPNAVDNGMAGIKDIRNEIGLENNFRVSNDGDKWLPIKFAGIGRGEFEPLGNYDYLDPFIVEWMQTVPEIKASFIEDETPDHWYRDVNPATGELIEPIVVPETLQSTEELEQELDWRRQNWTSSLMIRRRLQHLDHDRKQNRTHHIPVEQDCSVTMANVGKAQSTAIEEAKPAEAPKPENIRRPPTPSKPADDGITYCRWVPRMPCFLRPAEGVDMEAVAEIYNMEMKNGLQVWDSEPLSVDDWEKILAKSEELGMPFIVVVRGNVMNLGLNLQEKSGNFILSSFQRVPKDVKDPNAQRRGEILGFGFFSPWQLGLAGSASGVGRAAARMHIYVHPDYRRKSIGFSLMDMLMYCTSSRHISQDCFDFVDPDNDPVYWKPLRRAEQGKGKGRIFMSIYIGYFVKTKLVPYKDPQLEIAQKDYDKDLPWVHKLLYDKLHWEEKGRFEAAYRTAKCREGPPHWLDELLYEHQCQWDPRFHEDADKY